MLLALDDVHWADAASVEVMTHLLRRFRGPLLMAVAYRHAPTRLARRARGQLPAPASGPGSSSRRSARRRRQRLIGASVDERTRAMLYRESGGNPFYMEQLARSGHATGVRHAPGPEPLSRGGPPCGDRRDRGGADRGFRSDSGRARRRPPSPAIRSSPS